MKHKTLGQVYTPQWIVNEILDRVGYNNQSILDKYILEPASGDGVFLLEIVNRYVDLGTQNHLDVKTIITNLETYIIGIELDKIEYLKSIENLNNLITNKLGKDLKVNWNIHNENTLILFKNYTSFFDFVVGNPPYIRIHNLDHETRIILKSNFMFSSGTIDIYLSFFEMGLKMLNKNGRLGYITPNSYLHNSSYKLFRQYLMKHRLLETLIDFKAYKIFKEFSTYTAITILSKRLDKNNFAYKELIDAEIKDVNQIPYEKLNTKDWSFCNKADTQFIENLNKNKNCAVKDYFDVQYGFATLRDKIFISPINNFDANLVYFNNHLVEKDILKKIIKGSTFKGDFAKVDYVLFPYFKDDKRYKPIPEIELKKKYPRAYKYLELNRVELNKRDIDKGALWYEFGRSQGIQTMHNEKIVLSTLINGEVKYYRIPENVLMYSGLYIIKNKTYSEWSLVEEVLNSPEFYKFIRITGKDFSGGYKSITSKQIKEYKIFSNHYEKHKG